MSPLISILMPVYNTEAYVLDSVESVLKQTHSNLQLIIVNDGSTDGTANKLKQIKDSRVQIISQNNMGVSAALNKALELAKGSYIARNDSDDISFPTRLEKELAFLESNPSIGLLGAAAEIIDKNGTPTGLLKHPQHNDEIQYQMMWNSPFVSSTTLFRMECLGSTGRFYDGTVFFEDYHLWSSIARNWKLANLPDVLIQYRELTSGLSHTTANASERVINQRRLNLASRFPQMNAALREAFSLSGFHRSSMESLAALKQAYNEFLDAFTDADTPPEVKARIEDNLKQRMHTFQVFSANKKGLSHLLGRALEKVTYPLYLKQ
jgi:glycosyltransferase involved in cell wall biosynthesis